MVEQTEGQIDRKMDREMERWTDGRIDSLKTYVMAVGTGQVLLHLAFSILHFYI